MTATKVLRIAIVPLEIRIGQLQNAGQKPYGLGQLASCIGTTKVIYVLISAAWRRMGDVDVKLHFFSVP
jgi:hypothetical protein